MGNRVRSRGLLAPRDLPHPAALNGPVGRLVIDAIFEFHKITLPFIPAVTEILGCLLGQASLGSCGLGVKKSATSPPSLGSSDEGDEGLTHLGNSNGQRYQAGFGVGRVCNGESRSGQ